MYLISIIVTTYKRTPKMLLRAIESIRSQTYENIEIIIVDDSPSDYELRQSVKEAVEGIGDSRIRYIQMEKNSGACIARNRGAELAKGEYISFFDDDDEMLPDKTKSQLEALISHPECGWCQGNYQILDEKSGKMSLPRKVLPEGMVFDKLIRHKGNYSPTITPLVKKSIFDEVGGFDEKMPAGQDFDFWLRVSEHYPVCNAEGLMFTNHIHPGERTTRNPAKKLLAYELILEKYSGFFEENADAKALYYTYMVKYNLWLKRDEPAKAALSEAIKLRPFKAAEYNLRFLYWKLKYGRKSIG